MIVSAHGDDKDENGMNGGFAYMLCGAAFIFQYDGSQWVEIQKITGADRAGFRMFGSGVQGTNGVDIDGVDIIAGASGDKLDENGANSLVDAGKAYFFNPCQTAMPKNVDVNICFGESSFLENAWQNTSGTYEDTLRNNLGCDSVYVSTKLTVGAAPTSSADTFFVKVGDSVFIDFQWQKSPGTYMDTLKNKGGCDSLYLDTILVFYADSILIPSTTIEIPNVFSPNGDGVNDLLVIGSESGKELGVVIHNRWGQIVHEDVNNNPWDGTNNGKDVSEGTYFINVKEMNPSGEEFEYTGIITVKRN